jgi:subtilisin family serine protease
MIARSAEQPGKGGPEGFTLFFMSPLLAALMALTVLTGAGAQTAPRAGTSTVALPEYTPGEILIKLAPGTAGSGDRTDIRPLATGDTALDRLNRRFGVRQMTRALRPMPRAKADPAVHRLAGELSAIYRLRLAGAADVLEAVAAYRSDPGVIWAQPNYLNRPCVVPDDSLYGEQWALSTMRMPSAWDIEQGSPEIVIGFVDSGIDYHHEDLAANVWINPGEDLNANGQVDESDLNGLDDDANGYIDDLRGWDFTDAPQFAGLGDYLQRDNDPDDDLGHGTHVSGIAAAIGNNGVGTAGLCWHARIMPLRASFRLSVGAFLEDDDVSAGIVYAADNGAQVINMSWGDPRISPIVQDVVAYAYARGCVLVAAAGNVDEEGLFYPGGYDETIAMGASDIYDQRAGFSSFGKNLDVLAPGSNIVSTLPGDAYGTQGGTSMATAHGSGLAGLILSRNPELTAEEVRGIITASAHDLGPDGWDAQTGSGRVDGLDALRMERTTRVRIHSPSTGEGADERIAIVGTATGPDLQSYSLAYGLGLSPDELETILGPVEQQVWEETLMVWEGVAGLPDTAVAIRLQAVNLDGSLTEDRVVIHVDHTPPVLQDVRLVRRLDGEGYASFAEWRTDDESLPEVFFRRQGGEEFSVLGGVHWANDHSLDLSPELGPGQYQIYLAAVNAAGLRTRDDNAGQYYALSAPFEQVERGGFLLLDELPAGYQFERTTDMNGNGRSELLFMAFSDTSTYGPAVAYEMNDEGALEEVYRSQAHYLVWDVGDSDGDGRMEILGGGYASIALYESPVPNSFPDPAEPIWTEEGIWGSQFADTDRDGRMEIVSKLEVGSDVVIYENAADDSLARVASLPNPTNGRNSTGTRFAVADFDGDGRTGILAGDSDGDIYIYEWNGSDGYEHTWTESTGLEDTRYLAAGDSLEGGGTWFAVAANLTDVYDPGATFWRLTVYRSDGDDSFRMVWSAEVAGVSGQGNGLLAADVTGDGSKELVLCALPDLYVFGQTEGQTFAPVWYTPCGFMYRPFVGDLTGDGARELAFNGPDGMIVLEPADAEGAPPPPSGLTAYPLDRERIFLEWTAVEQAAGYHLYRGPGYYDLDRLESDLTGLTYVDSGLVEDQTYYYAATTVDSTGRESRFYSSVVWATPNAPPRLDSIRVITGRHMAVLFNESMGPSAQVASHYSLYPGNGQDLISAPSSVLLDRGDRRALLTFEHPLEPETSYRLATANLYDASGVPLEAASGVMSFTTPPEESMQPLIIRRAELLGRTGLEVLFSEPVDPVSAENADHYVLEPSGSVDEARIDSLQSDRVRLELSGLEQAGILYTLTVSGVWNLALEKTLLPGIGDAVSFALPATDLSQAVAAPTPFLPGRDGVLTFQGLPPGTTVTILSLSGERIWEDRVQLGGEIEWGGLNDHGREAAAGVYLYTIVKDREVKRGKLVLVR